MRYGKPVRWLSVAALAAAAVLLIAPVRANYIDRADTDVITLYRASCGPSVLSILGAEAGLGGGSSFPMGQENARQACQAAAGKRVVIALIVFSSVSLLTIARIRRRGIARLDTDQPAGAAAP